VSSISVVAAPSQRRALGALFLVLAVAFGGIAFAAGTAGEWIIVAAAAAIALWMAGLAARGLRP
jgi:membrane protein YdbS with pleckstrin-like domain